MKNIRNSFDEPAKVIKRADAPEEIMYALTFSDAVSGYFKQHFSKENFKRILRETFPNEADAAKEKVRKCVRLISFILLIAGLGYFVFYYHGYRERIKMFEDWYTTIENIDESELPEFEIKQLWNNIKQQYPDVDFPEGMSLKFASLYAVNQDAVGALHIPGKELWVPLLQNKSAPDYYLWKDMYGEYNRYGNPYVDYRCDMSKDGLSKNTIVYGHNTHDKLGFNKLTTYMTLDGYKEAPVVTLETLYEKTQWKIFGIILTNSGSAADRGHLFHYLAADFSSEDEFMTMVDGIYERSMINTEIDVNKDDKVLTLYTCYQDIFEGGRLVVFARLLREGESAEVDVSKATYNSNARYPQAYYDNKGITNPYEKLTQPYISAETATKVSENEKTTSSSNGGNSSGNNATVTQPSATLPVQEDTTAAPTEVPEISEQPSAETPATQAPAAEPEVTENNADA